MHREGRPTAGRQLGKGQLGDPVAVHTFQRQSARQLIWEKRACMEGLHSQGVQGRHALHAHALALGSSALFIVHYFYNQQWLLTPTCSWKNKLSDRQTGEPCSPACCGRSAADRHATGKHCTRCSCFHCSPIWSEAYSVEPGRPPLCVHQGCNACYRVLDSQRLNSWFHLMNSKWYRKFSRMVAYNLD